MDETQTPESKRVAGENRGHSKSLTSKPRVLKDFYQVIPNSLDVEWFADQVDTLVEDNDLYLDLALETPRENSYYRIASSILYFLLSIVLQYIIPSMLIHDFINKGDLAAACPGQSNWHNKLAAMSCMYYLYGTLGFTNIGENLDLFKGNIEKSQLMESEWFIIQTGAALNNRSRYLTFGLVIKSLCCSMLIPAATYVLFIQNPDLADLILNAIAMNFLVEVPKTLKLMDYGDAKERLVNHFREKGVTGTMDFGEFTKKNRVACFIFIFTQGIGLVSSYALSVTTAICL